MATKSRAQRSAGPKSGRLGRVAFAVLVVLAVLALAAFLVLRTGDQASIAENAIGSALAPIQTAVSRVTTFIRDSVSGVRDYFRMSENLQNAQIEIADLKLQVMEMQEATHENERLRTLLEVKERYAQMTPVHARVIAKNPGVWFDTFTINKGTDDDIQVNMAVMTGDGLVGRVFEVGKLYAKVMSVIHVESRVSCLIERTRSEGVMYGQEDRDASVPSCRMVYIPSVGDVVPGDVVITSGVDEIYPKGLKVGVVSEVSRLQSDTSDRFILVRPTADFMRVEDVLVLRTIVETASDDRPLPVLPTPTPRPTPIATPTPKPTPSPTGAGGLDDVFNYPQGTQDDEGNWIEAPDASITGQPGAGDTPPEDAWAQ